MDTNQMSKHSKRQKPTKKPQGQEENAMSQKAIVLSLLLPSQGEGDLTESSIPRFPELSTKMLP